MGGAMANERSQAGAAARTPAKNAIVPAAPSAPNGNGPAKAYRHKGEKRRNIPPAAIAAEGRVPAAPKLQYSYSPRLDPVLRFDSSSAPDKLPELLERAKREPLTDAEARLLAEALRRYEPWLEWAGKREANGFAVDPVALQIYERVSTQAILKVAARKDVTRDLFADPQLEYHQAVQFYRHEMDWCNRLILGDSLLVMASLAQREDLAGKVKMIYVDPPYGIKFGSNFQNYVRVNKVGDQEKDLTREPETIRAYRDTWTLGVHSYLTYLRDRLYVCRTLLREDGSIFIQIGVDNLHRVRCLADEVFGALNFISVITVKKTATPSSTLDDGAFYLLWYAKDSEQVKLNQIFVPKPCDEWARDTPGGSWGMENEGIRRALTPEEKADTNSLPAGADVFALSKLTSDGAPAIPEPFDAFGQRFLLNANEHWKTSPAGLNRLLEAERLEPRGRVWFVKFYTDGQFKRLTNVWEDTAGKSSDVRYVVKTQPNVIERCILLTTKPGELILDPTCGSGTTAYAAEKLGRRWITIDTSRVAIAFARQRLLTEKFEFFELKNEAQGVAGGFQYEAAPHITLKSIAHNENLDAIFVKHQAALHAALGVCNAALAKVLPRQKADLRKKLDNKIKQEGKRAVTDADRRRLILPPANRDEAANWIVDRKFGGWYPWEVPFDSDPDWPKDLQDAVNGYRATWRLKMAEVIACIKANAKPEELLNEPVVRAGVVRVSGPFTIEAVQPQELSLDDSESPIGGEPEPDEATFHLERPSDQPPTVEGQAENREAEAKNADSYVENMIRLLRIDGVRFPDNKEMRFSRLDAIGARSTTIHAEGRWGTPGETDPDPEGQATVCVAFGPQYGPVTAAQVETLMRAASRRGYDDLLIAGFAFDGPAQTVIEEADHPNVRIHMAHIRPDVNPAMNGLLKETAGSQLFSVFGRPRTELQGPAKDGSYTISMQGVDIYDPVTNTIDASRADKVAAWFLDTDYDGRTFCITQAFFPDKTAWDKLAKALKGAVNETAFEALAGTVSLPFHAGEHLAVAVKVIDPRGNEVMRVHRLA